jgi:arginine decarboxylase
MHAIGHNRPPTRESLVFATQSTHKTLAGLSQASQILVNDALHRKLNHHVFNEAYMMHTSTSPLYSIIASCDVAAQMMDGPGGRALVQEAIEEAMNFRRAMRKAEKNARDWWFGVWGPDELPAEGIGARNAWMMKPDEKWHGFTGLTADFTMLDPVKATVLTPGLDVNGQMRDTGIPAAIVAKYLCEHRVIVEKCGLYSFFIMFTIGITHERWKNLIDELKRFKNYYDTNAPLSEAMPQFAAAQPFYEGWGLKDLCQKIHESYRQADIARTTTRMYVSGAELAMKPSAAFAKMAHEEIERVTIDDLEGRVTAVLLTPYPPGIPLLIPGERFNKAIVDYLKFARDFNRRFPGFENDVHGLVVEGHGPTKRYFVDCVRA